MDALPKRSAGGIHGVFENAIDKLEDKIGSIRNAVGDSSDEDDFDEADEWSDSD